MSENYKEELVIVFALEISALYSALPEIFFTLKKSITVDKFINRRAYYAIKERIFGAVTVMNDSDAEKVWNFVIENLSPRSWDDIEEVSPDEWDLKMLEDIDKNPDCHEYVSQDELLKELNLTL